MVPHWYRTTLPSLEQRWWREVALCDMLWTLHVKGHHKAPRYVGVLQGIIAEPGAIHRRLAIACDAQPGTPPPCSSRSDREGTTWWYVLYYLYPDALRPSHSEPANPIQPMGRLAASLLMPPPPPPNFNHISSGGPHVLLPGHQSRGGSFLQGPLTAPPAAPRSIWDASPLALMSGYTENHLTYAALRDRLSKLAYAGHGGEVVVVQAEVAILPEGKRTLKVIGVGCAIPGLNWANILPGCHWSHR